MIFFLIIKVSKIKKKYVVVCVHSLVYELLRVEAVIKRILQIKLFFYPPYFLHLISTFGKIKSVNLGKEKSETRFIKKKKRYNFINY